MRKRSNEWRVTSNEQCKARTMCGLCIARYSLLSTRYSRAEAGGHEKERVVQKEAESADAPPYMSA